MHDNHSKSALALNVLCRFMENYKLMQLHDIELITLVVRFIIQILLIFVLNDKSFLSLLDTMFSLHILLN